LATLESAWIHPHASVPGSDRWSRAISPPEPYDTCDGDLYLADPRTGGLCPLVVQPCVQSEPTWSPGGRLVTFENHGGLWVADADGRATPTE
jgi:hypothetical protein